MSLHLQHFWDPHLVNKTQRPETYRAAIIERNTDRYSSCIRFLSSSLSLLFVQFKFVLAILFFVFQVFNNILGFYCTDAGTIVSFVVGSSSTTKAIRVTILFLFHNMYKSTLLRKKSRFQFGSLKQRNSCQVLCTCSQNNLPSHHE